LIADKPMYHRIMHLLSRLTFRGIYFPQMGKRAWLRLVYDNRRPIYDLVREGVNRWRKVTPATNSTTVPIPGN
jgi:hypothetical protein